VSLTIGATYANAKEEPLVVAMVENTSDYKTMRPLVEEWSKKTGHPVKIITENTTTYPVNYVLAARTGSPNIDVIAMWDFFIGQFYSFMEPLDGSDNPKIKLDAADLSDFSEAFMTPFKGHVYVLPFGLDTRLLYYRKDLLEKAGFSEPPKTWSELVKVAQALTKDTNGDGVIDQWGFATLGMPSYVFNTFSFFDFLFQAGGKIFDENGQPAFNSEAGVKALQFFVDLRNKYKVMPPDVTTYDNNPMHTGFLNGSFAMANHWPYMQGMIEQSKLAGKVGYAPEPSMDGRKPATTLNAWSLGIMKMSKQKELAFDLIKYVTNKKSGIFELSKKLDWPLRKSVYSSEAARKLVPENHWEFSKLVFDIANKYGHPVRPLQAAEFGEVLSKAIDLAMHGKATPKEALDQAAQKTKEILR
jgi:multiple sugar transport system substrate-binding protein